MKGGLKVKLTSLSTRNKRNVEVYFSSFNVLFRVGHKLLTKTYSRN